MEPNDKIFKTTQEVKARTILNDLFNIGIDLEDRKNKVVIHTLRHTFASHLAINGTPIFTIQKLMNHKDIKMTLRYAKLSPDSGREAILNLGI
ncbi:tyrosine-type recombinase/integrase [Aliarcobacter cryaerophilus]|uniref:tyrosine-type recombinase/integrase n=1 Tax=Aliarcobacter cryaerophilus TaxID=28198 RepID=UPI001A9C7879|nr:tyrosine-type recombinase/integrase [Aliarcobacter cryaerophilus]